MDSRRILARQSLVRCKSRCFVRLAQAHVGAAAGSESSFSQHRLQERWDYSPNGTLCKHRLDASIRTFLRLPGATSAIGQAWRPSNLRLRVQHILKRYSGVEHIYP